MEYSRPFPECVKPHAITMLIELTKREAVRLDPRDGKAVADLVRLAIKQGGVVFAHQFEDLVFIALHWGGAHGQVHGLLEALGCAPVGVCHKASKRDTMVMVSGGYRIADVVAALLHLEFMGAKVLAEPATTVLAAHIEATKRAGDVITYAEQKIIWAAKERTAALKTVLKASLTDMPVELLEEEIWQSPSGYTMELCLMRDCVLLVARSERMARAERKVLDHQRKKLSAEKAGRQEEDEPVF